MAKHVPFAKAVNAAEDWAFSLLKNALPDHYWLLTNIELLTETGQAMEIDAVVVGDWGVYLIDVKGYSGTLEAGKDVWLLDGRPVDNALRKANQNSRVLAGRIRNRAGIGLYAPWCQGVVLVTGDKGHSISLIKDEPSLQVWTPDGITKALTCAEGLTATKAYELVDAQRELVLATLGQLRQQIAENNRFQQYQKTQCLLDQNGLELWMAEYRLESWSSKWMLKIVNRPNCECQERREQLQTQLRDEFRLLQELAGLTGVTYSAPLIDDGELMVLPISMPKGKPLSLVDLSKHSEESARSTLISALTAIQGIHRRGATLGGVSNNSIYLTDAGEVCFIDILNNHSAGDDIDLITSLFKPLVDTLHLEISRSNDAEGQETSERLSQLIANLMSERASTALAPSGAPFEAEPGAILDNRYELVEQVDEDAFSSIWRSRHVAGRFDCAVQIYDDADEVWELVADQYHRLAQIYHPALERVFDLARIPNSDAYFISRAWASGETLFDQASISADEFRHWLEQLLAGLGYLHRLGLTHRNITPLNILVDGARATLVGMSSLPAEDRRVGDLRYKFPGVIEQGWSAFADLYGLWASLLDGLQPGVLKQAGGNLERAIQQVTHPALNDGLKAKVAKLLHEGTAFHADDYVAWFGLDITTQQTKDLPDAFAKKWGISKGYMTFLVVDMLNDQRPRIRSQWVIDALRSRRIPGNKTNKASMNATFSRMKSAGIVEEFKTKHRLTEPFLVDWETSQ